MMPSKIMTASQIWIQLVSVNRIRKEYFTSLSQVCGKLDQDGGKQKKILRSCSCWQK